MEKSVSPKTMSDCPYNISEEADGDVIMAPPKKTVEDLIRTTFEGYRKYGLIDEDLEKDVLAVVAADHAERNKKLQDILLDAEVHKFFFPDWLNKKFEELLSK